MEATTKPLHPNAEALLRRISSGSNIAVPSVYPGSLAGLDHAAIFFSNAVALSKGHGLPDFEIFGVLYGMRHGLELFLKCMCQNKTIDDLLLRCSEGASLHDLQSWLVATNAENAKAQKRQLLKVLSVIRNLRVDDITAPDCWTVNQATEQDSKFAIEGLKYLQANGHLDRYVFANLWIPPFRTHNLLKLFEGAENGLRAMHAAADQYSHKVGVGRPGQIDLVEATCHLFESWDPDGHAIRYATSSGASSSVTVHGWNLHLPSLDLGALGKLAEELGNTVEAYDALLSDCYSFAKIRWPYPSYESMCY